MRIPAAAAPVGDGRAGAGHGRRASAILAALLSAALLSACAPSGVDPAGSAGGADGVAAAGGDVAGPEAETAPPSDVEGDAAGAVAARASIATFADAAWVAAVADRTGIPQRALAAYAGAAIAVSRTHPSCGLGWNTLAAIGHVESEHGTIGGSHIDDDGVARPAIVGIALDGTASARIPDTDDGVLDGDVIWDRAVGPMQFIPSTWREHRQDGNGDGEYDVDQIDDAALTAAVYLCVAGGDLTVPARWIAAIHAYNADVSYNNRVADAAAHYATLG